MSLDADIQDALLTHIKTPALTSPATPIAFPLVAFTPTPGVAYFEAHAVMRADTDRPFVGFDSDAIHRGIFQVDAVTPDNIGEAPGLALAALVAARFATGTMLVAGAFRLKVLRAVTIGTVVKDKPWVRFPVSIPYFLAAG